MSSCAIHDKVEPQTASSKQCFECFHVFQDDAEILRIYNEQFRNKHKSADRIVFCPYCLHDW